MTATCEEATMTVHPKFADAVKAMAAVNADKAVLADILDNQDRLPDFGVDTPKKIAHFLSQVGSESGGFAIAIENMFYTAKRLMVVWPSRFKTLEKAQEYEKNPQKLANFVYANRMGNGDSASGDGFRYRGRGLLQLTGRSMYKGVGAAANLPLEEHPEIAEHAPNALVIAGGAWKFDGVDKLSENATVEAYTQKINGGQTNIADRKKRFAKVVAVMGL
jgi:putative chitinase